jgi:hypothetical protein
MKKLLINSDNILFGPFSEIERVGFQTITESAIYPIDFETLELGSLPEGFESGKFTYLNGEFSAIAEPEPDVVIPSMVTMVQARKAMILSGVSIATVNGAIAGIANAQARELAQTDWEYSATVRRDSGLIASLGAGLNLTNDQIDAMFVLAATL